MSSSKISIVLASTALALSLLFATPLGQAASRFVLPKNSVGAAQLKKNAVGTKKIAKNAVNSAKVKDGWLLAGDSKAGQRAELRLRGNRVKGARGLRLVTLSRGRRDARLRLVLGLSA